MSIQYFALVNNDNSGPAFGAGLSEGAAEQDAARWSGQDYPDTKTVEITRKSYFAVKAGNPDK